MKTTYDCLIYAILSHEYIKEFRFILKCTVFMRTEDTLVFFVGCFP